MTDKTDALVALENMKANGFDLGLDNEDYLALDAAIEALAAPAEGDGAVYQWREFAGRWEDFTKEQFDEVQSSGEIVLGETIITPAMTRKLYTRPAATAQVPEGLVVLADEMDRHAARLPSDAGKMLKHYSGKLRDALAALATGEQP